MSGGNPSENRSHRITVCGKGKSDGLTPEREALEQTFLLSKGLENFQALSGKKLELKLRSTDK